MLSQIATGLRTRSLLGFNEFVRCKERDFENFRYLLSRFHIRLEHIFIRRTIIQKDTTDVAVKSSVCQVTPPSHQNLISWLVKSSKLVISLHPSTSQISDLSWQELIYIYLTVATVELLLLASSLTLSLLKLSGHRSAPTAPCNQKGTNNQR